MKWLKLILCFSQKRNTFPIEFVATEQNTTENRYFEKKRLFNLTSSTIKKMNVEGIQLAKKKTLAKKNSLWKTFYLLLETVQKKRVTIFPSIYFHPLHFKRISPNHNYTNRRSSFIE